MKIRLPVALTISTLALIAGIAGTNLALAEKQPAMRGALNDLRAAERKLERATSDKGGHRAAALGLVRQAIAQVQKGMGHDNRN